MLKHVRRVVTVIAPLGLMAGYLLTHDIAETLKQADKSASEIATALGFSNPPQHMATYVWQHPFLTILSAIFPLIVGAALSALIELVVARLRGKTKAVPFNNLPQHPELRATNSVIDDESDRHRDIINTGRDLAFEYTRSGESNFRKFLERTRRWPNIRPYISADYLGKLEAPRTAYAMEDGAEYEPLVQWFLAEIDRLEREWGLAPKSPEQAPDIPLDINSLGAYLRGFPRVRKLTREISERTDQPIAKQEPGGIGYLEQAQALGFTSVAQLDRAFADNEELVVRMGAYLIPSKLSHLFTLSCLMDVIGGKMGADAYWNAMKGLKYHSSSRGWCEDMEKIYGYISSY